MHNCEITVNPRDINYSQKTVNKNFDTREGKKPIKSVINKGPDQVKEFPAIKVAEVNGQMVVIDGNSRLLIAQVTKSKGIKVVIDNSLQGRKELAQKAKAPINNLPMTGTSKKPIPR